MHHNRLRTLLEQLQTGTISVEQAMEQLSHLPFEELDCATGVTPFFKSTLPYLAVSPVITTAAGGIRELVENNRDGLLYQPHDVEGIAAGIIRLLHNPHVRSQLGREASKKVREQFDIAQAASRLRDLFAQAEGMAPIEPLTTAEAGRNV